MPWNWAPNVGYPVHPEDSNQYFGNGLLPLPTFLMTHFSGDQNSNNAQPSHQYDRPYPLLGPGPQYNSHRCQNDNRNLPQHDGGFRSRRNHSNDRGTCVRSTSRWGSPVASEHNRRHVSRQSPSVYHERVNARLQPNSCDPSPRYKSNENLPDTRGVKLKKLPFSDVISTLLQVDIINLGYLASHYYFIFKPKELEDILSNKNDLPYKVKLRFCNLDGSGEQEDNYPKLLQVAVNNNLCFLPGTDRIPRGPPGPVNITFMCNLMGSNDVAVRNVDTRRVENLRMFVQLVKELTSQDLIDRLKAKNPTKPEDTASQIKEKLQEDQTGNEIASTTFSCSLLCPLSKTRMKLPCRATSCSHFQCFDAVTYLQMNELKQKWSCPVCSGPAIYDHLQIDGYFKAVLEQNISSDKIILLADGSWKPLQSDKKRRQQTTVDNVELSVNSMVSTPNRTVDLDSDSDGSNKDFQEVNLQDKNRGIDCLEVIEQDERLGDSDDCQEVFEQDENRGFDCQEVIEQDETLSFDCGEVIEEDETQNFDCQEVIEEDETQAFDCQEVIEQKETQEYNKNDNTARDVSPSVVTITLSDDESFIKNPQTSNCITGFCSTPKTSVQTRRSSHFHGSPVQFIDTTHASQSSASHTPHRYSLRSSNASQTSRLKKRLGPKKSSKTGYSTNSNINSFGSNSGISNHSNSLNNIVNSHGNSDSECLRRESRISTSSGSDTSDAVPHQRSSDHCGMPRRAGLVQKNILWKARKLQCMSKKQKKLNRLKKHAFRRSRGKRRKKSQRRNVIDVF